MMQLIPTDQHGGDFRFDFTLQKAGVDEVLSHFLDLVKARVG